MKRLVLPLIAVAVVLVAYLATQGPETRSDRTALQRAAELEKQRDREGGRAGQESGVASAARIAALIKEHGGFTSKGVVRLTLPDAPGENVTVVLRASFESWMVEGRANSDADGAFRFAALPRADDYVLTVEEDALQPFRRDAIGIDAAEHDFGDVIVDRYYFVKGRVTGGGNRAVPGAEVALVGGMSNNDFSFLQQAREAKTRDPVLAKTETAADGRFSLRLTRPGSFTLRAVAKGWAPHYRTNLIVDARADADHEIALTRGYPIVGYVLDGTGRPLPEAAVALYAMRGWWMGGSAKELAVTDDGGRFEFLVEPYNARYSLRVVPPKGIDIIQIIDLPVEDDIIVRLPGAGVLTGKVVSDATKQPVVGAEVLIGLAKSATPSWMPDYGKPVRTDEYGVYRFEGVGNAFLHSISVRAEGYEQVSLARMYPTDRVLWDRLAKIKLSAENQVTMPDIPLKRGRMLSGTVKEADSGRPIPGAIVELRDFVMGNRGTTADADGRYRFEGVSPRVGMAVTAPGYAPFSDPPFRGTTLPPDEKQTVRDFELESGGIIEGLVSNAAGQPVEGALVRFETAATGRASWMQSMTLRPFFAYTGKDGKYAFVGVPPVKLRATAEAPGYDMGRSKDQQVKAGTRVDNLKISLPLAARFSGKVVSREGGPVEGARVTIAKDPGKDADTTAQWRALGAGKSGFTSKNGDFSIRDVPTGNVLIRIEADAFATATVRRGNVKPGEAVTALRLELAPAYVITGRVLDPNGKALANCWIRANHASSPDGEPTSQLLGARVENDGAFMLRNLPAGSYRIEVRLGSWTGAPQYSNLVREGVVAGTKDLEIRLSPAE